MNSLFKKFTDISPSGYQYKEKKSTHPFWEEEGGGTVSNYNDLDNKPSINGVTLQGNKTSAQLSMYTKAEVDALIEAIPTGTDNYEDLSNLPKIAGVTLKGNKSLSDLGILTQAQIESLVNAKLDKDKGVFYDEGKLKYYYHPTGFPEGYYRTEEIVLPKGYYVHAITPTVVNAPTDGDDIVLDGPLDYHGQPFAKKKEINYVSGSFTGDVYNDISVSECYITSEDTNSFNTLLAILDPSSVPFANNKSVLLYGNNIIEGGLVYYITKDIIADTTGTTLTFTFDSWVGINYYTYTQQPEIVKELQLFGTSFPAGHGILDISMPNGRTAEQFTYELVMSSSAFNDYGDNLSLQFVQNDSDPDRIHVAYNNTSAAPISITYYGIFEHLKYDTICVNDGGKVLAYSS